MTGKEPGFNPEREQQPQIPEQEQNEAQKRIEEEQAEEEREDLENLKSAFDEAEMHAKMEEEFQRTGQPWSALLSTRLSLITMGLGLCESLDPHRVELAHQKLNIIIAEVKAVTADFHAKRREYLAQQAELKKEVGLAEEEEVLDDKQRYHKDREELAKLSEMFNPSPEVQERIISDLVSIKEILFPSESDLDSERK